MVDDIDTDSSIPSISEQNYSNGSQTGWMNSAAYRKLDTYSIVGSLNTAGMGGCLNGTSGSGLYLASVQQLNVGGLQREDPMLTIPGGTFGNSEAARLKPRKTEASNPQPLRMEELLNIRLDQVTSDLSQPPYDSLQTYQYEGCDSRAESLSSLESDREKGDGRPPHRQASGGGMEELNQKFQRLVEIIRDRQKEKETHAAEECFTKPHKQKDNKEKQEHRWDF